jgi:uncharacterized protein YfaS (alpha-2-macroglobulin family)
VQLAIALQKMGDQPRADQALQAGLAAGRNDSDWLGDYGTPLRDQALILALLQENDLSTSTLEERLFTLSDLLAGNGWLSTQERNALYLAGRNALALPEQPWTAQVQSAGVSHLLSDAQPALKLADGALSESLTVTSQAQQPLYQQVTLSGYPVRPPAPHEENLSIRRQYLSLDGEPLKLDTLKSGELVLVHLVVGAKQRVPDALVVDLLPAGLEIENQNLALSAASLDNASSSVRQWRESMQNANLQHQEFRDDRYVAALKLDGYGSTHLLYLARAVTPGIYKVPPPQVESMYRPNWQAVGITPADLTVRPR